MKILNYRNGTPRCRKLEELNALPANRKMDFLSNCYKSDPEHMAILAIWENHFKLKGVPWASCEVEKHRSMVTIIKERRA